MKIYVFALVLAALLPAAALAVDGDSILGVWLSPSDVGSAHIDVYKNGNKYFGKIVWLEKPVFSEKDPQAGQPKTDRRNPDEKLRPRPVMGLVILQNLQYAGDGEWKGGTIYAPDKGKTYKCQAKLGPDGVLHFRGFIGFSFIGETRDWTRVK